MVLTSLIAGTLKQNMYLTAFLLDEGPTSGSSHLVLNGRARTQTRPFQGSVNSLGECQGRKGLKGKRAGFLLYPSLLHLPYEENGENAPSFKKDVSRAH